MYQFNRSITSSNSIIDKKYEPPYTQSLNIQNNFKTRKIFPRSNIPLYKKYSLFSQKTINPNIPSLSHSISKTVSNKSHMDYHNNSNNNRIITEYGKKPNNLKNKYRGIPIRINTNKKIEKDLEMMKLQMSCDLITHKINQIKDKVQNLHEASIEDDKNLINKNMGINVYQKKKSNYIDIYSNKDCVINNNYKRYVFMDFSKLRNKKFLKISNEMSKEINNTFDNSELNRINDNFRTFQNSEFDLDLSTKVYNNKIIKLSYKSNLKHLLLNTQSNEKEILNDNINNIYNIDDNNKLEIKQNILNDINKSADINYTNNRTKKNIKNNNNKILKSHKPNIKSNKIISSLPNNQNYSKNINNNPENNGKNIIYNKVRMNLNKNKNKLKENNVQTNQKKNNNKFINTEFGSLDKYFLGDNLIKDKNIIIRNPKEKNLYNNNRYNIQQNNNEIEKQNLINQLDEDNKIKIEEYNENNINNNEKLLFYSNLLQSKQDNINLNKYYKKNLNKNNLYYKLENNNGKENKNIKKKKDDINKQNNIDSGETMSYSYFDLRNDQKKNIDKNYKNNILKKCVDVNNDNNEIHNSNDAIIQSNNNDINNNNNENINKSIKDNNFKININNIANYSIKNNCLNITNSSNRNKKNENETNNIKNIEESNKRENIKHSHNYSKDDLIITSEKINLEYSPDEALEKNKTKPKINNDIIKRNLTFEKDDIILAPITEENIGDAIDKKNSKRKNIVIMPRAKYKSKDKKVKIKHKELCHKFMDNPQHFFTVKLNEMMLKALNINIKGIGTKK